MYNDVSDDDSIDDGTEWNGDNVERTECDWESAEGGDHCCSEVDATGSFVHWTGEDAVEWGKVESSTHIFDAMAKYSGKITWGNWPSNVRAIRSSKQGSMSVQLLIWITSFTAKNKCILII